MTFLKTIILSCYFFTNSVFSELQSLDKIAAIIGHDLIFESEIDIALNSINMNVKNYKKNIFNDITLRQKILDRIIIDKIMLKLAEHNKINISNERINQEIHNIASKKKITMEQLQNNLPDNIKDYNTYRTKIHKELLIAKVYNKEICRRITILPQEINSLVKKISLQTCDSSELNLSHIFLALPQNVSKKQINSSKKLAKYLIKKNKDGISFEKLASAYSSDTKVIQDGIGWEKSQVLQKLFPKTLKGIQKGDIIGPLFSDKGLYIFKINDIFSEQKKISEVYIRHILLYSSEKIFDEKLKDQLYDILKKITSGYISFSDAAKLISEDLNSSYQGGDLGWRFIETFEPCLHDILINLNKGEISIPVYSSYGWHLIQLIDVRQVNVADYAQKKKLAYQILFNHKFCKESPIWMKEQRASVYIKIFNRNV